MLIQYYFHTVNSEKKNKPKSQRHEHRAQRVTIFFWKGLPFSVARLYFLLLWIAKQLWYLLLKIIDVKIKMQYENEVSAELNKCYDNEERKHKRLNHWFFCVLRHIGFIQAMCRRLKTYSFMLITPKFIMCHLHNGRKQPTARR